VLPYRRAVLPRLDVGHDAKVARLYCAITASATASPLAGANAALISEAVATMRARLSDERFEAANAKAPRWTTEWPSP
jgi:hypothetical protein